MTTEQENEILKLKLKALQYQIAAYQLNKEVEELVLKYQQETEDAREPAS